MGDERDTGGEGAGALVDGRRPLAPAEVLGVLTALGVEFETCCHRALYTVAESKALRETLPEPFASGGHVKNLFLRNRKGGMWLLTFLEDRQLDLRALGSELGAGRLTFASEARLMGYLGVRPGAVTPLAVANDRSGAVTVVLDAALLEHAWVNVHPLVSTMTAAIGPRDLIRLLQHLGHSPLVLSLDQFTVER